MKQMDHMKRGNNDTPLDLLLLFTRRDQITNNFTVERLCDKRLIETEVRDLQFKPTQDNQKAIDYLSSFETQAELANLPNSIKIKYIKN